MKSYSVGNLTMVQSPTFTNNNEIFSQQFLCYLFMDFLQCVHRRFFCLHRFLGFVLAYLNRQLKGRKETNQYSVGKMALYSIGRHSFGSQIPHMSIEVDKAKIETIKKLPPPTSKNVVRTFLGHAKLLEKDASFYFYQECINTFCTLREKLTNTPIVVVPDSNLPFKL